MIKLLIWGLLLYVGYRIIMSLCKKKQNLTAQSSAGSAAATHLDPVCGIYVSEEDAVVGTLDGRRHYFCSRVCMEKYREKLENK